MTARRVLIIGGTGVFGARMARHLASCPDLTLFVSSRSAAKAGRFVRTLKGAAQLRPISLNRQDTLVARLAEIKPHVVVDCSGPFQGALYETAAHVLRSGAHFVDLADARDYLAGFKASLDDLARSCGVVALAGASSSPTFATTVADHLTAGWKRVDVIDICITPGGKIKVGRAAIEAVLSYAGHDIPIWQAGQLSTATGWRGARRIDIPDLGRRRVALVETFDAENLGARLEVQSRVSFAAGLESFFEQRGIEAIAALRRLGFLANAAALAPFLQYARHLTRLSTSDIGGMLVEIGGLDAQGIPCMRRWSLVARAGDGPFVPILPAAAAVKKLLNEAITPGARPAFEEITLAEIIKEMRPYAITTRVYEKPMKEGIFGQALSQESFAALPKAVAAFHSADGFPVWSGRADISGGSSLFARLARRAFRFPQPGRDVSVTVTVDRSIGSEGKPLERWTRNFAGNHMTSELRFQRAGVLEERFGPFRFEIALDASADDLWFPVSAWRLGRLPLPRFLAPRSVSREFVDAQGRFCFDVRLALPLLGTIVHYKGWLAPANQTIESPKSIR